MPKQPKQVVTVRLRPEVAAWAIAGGDRTRLVESLLDAYRERRIVIMASPAPEIVNCGDDPGWPVLVTKDNQ